MASEIVPALQPLAHGRLRSLGKGADYSAHVVQTTPDAGSQSETPRVCGVRDLTGCSSPEQQGTWNLDTPQGEGLSHRVGNVSSALGSPCPARTRSVSEVALQPHLAPSYACHPTALPPLAHGQGAAQHSTLPRTLSWEWGAGGVQERVFPRMPSDDSCSSSAPGSPVSVSSGGGCAETMTSGPTLPMPWLRDVSAAFPPNARRGSSGSSLHYGAVASLPSHTGSPAGGWSGAHAASSCSPGQGPLVGSRGAKLTLSKPCTMGHCTTTAQPPSLIMTFPAPDPWKAQEQKTSTPTPVRLGSHAVSPTAAHGTATSGAAQQRQAPPLARFSPTSSAAPAGKKDRAKGGCQVVFSAARQPAGTLGAQSTPVVLHPQQGSPLGGGPAPAHDKP